MQFRIIRQAPAQSLGTVIAVMVSTWAAYSIRFNRADTTDYSTVFSMTLACVKYLGARQTLITFEARAPSQFVQHACFAWSPCSAHASNLPALTQTLNTLQLAPIHR